MTQNKPTPMMTQYLEIKSKHPDSILFYRMGDFFEMFFEDAEKASKVLEIALTSRDKKSANPIPMCGIPAKAADSYIAKLIGAGLKVAVCEQIEDPKAAKGLVKRDVTRVVTPGMILDTALLDEKSNNFILSIHRNNGLAGLACLDISTGTFRLCESKNLGALFDESVKLAPSEILLPESLRADRDLAPLKEALQNSSFTYLEDREFDHRGAKKRLTEQFNTRSLEGFGCENQKAGVAAAGAILSYVSETQLQKIEHLDRIETYGLDDYLVMDDSSLRNLELISNLRDGSRKGTLVGTIDKTVTAMGGRLLKSWVRSPLLVTEAIEARLDAVSEAKEHMTRRSLAREDLGGVFDLERLASRIAMNQGNARDLSALKNSLLALPRLLEQLTDFSSALYRYDGDAASLSELAELLHRAVREDAPLTLQDGGIIREGYDAELDELIRLTTDGKSWIAELEVSEREKTGLSSLKVKYNKVFGYFIEVSKAQSTQVPENYIRKQTLVNAERYITEELKEFETKVLHAVEKRSTLEYQIFCSLRDAVTARNAELSSASRFIARVDVLLALAEIADHNGYTRPVIASDGAIDIRDGRHPVVEKMITAERYVPNSIRLDNTENQVILITGPNMAGKSTVLRQVALITVMAQLGSFVPAAKAIISVTDRIFTRVGALDNLSQGQSTFMVEMEETANILNNATSNSLIIMDEIGRGTSTYDGLSIAWAVAEYLHDLSGTGVKTLFATHYHELTELEGLKPRVKNFNIAVKEWNENIIFLRKLVEGGTNRSYGIQVARLAGVPQTVIKRAKKVLSVIESDENGDQKNLGRRLGEGLPETRCGKKAKPLKKKAKKESGFVQLALFPSKENPVLEKLQAVDINATTPLQALALLNELKALAEEESDS
ncbi:DNA mismatch repair protein MutS [Desulfoluna limicola]|uniref:DNA mismatch repair protein MutS n=1 Tax=Desulfoluna limicola TaxID=2810562 RepID=A0ABM7PH29_9BACT|nr:DNA mismatch repair protein MutS [Desulfoluna limicola]BCS96431.1 DNA mismatch repair protein MutS [Desulfoluna limicola]